jgi:hypothetical protein
VRDLHALNAVVLLAANLLAFGWGLYFVLRKRPPGRIYAHVLALAQALLIAQVALGLLLLSEGRRVADDLHYLYGLLPLAVSLLAETVRAGAAHQEIGDIDFHALEPERQRSIALAIVRREMGIMATSALVIFFLALRAAGTSTAF